MKNTGDTILHRVPKFIKILIPCAVAVILAAAAFFVINFISSSNNPFAKIYSSLEKTLNLSSANFTCNYDNINGYFSLGGDFNSSALDFTAGTDRYVVCGGDWADDFSRKADIGGETLFGDIRLDELVKDGHFDIGGGAVSDDVKNQAQALIKNFFLKECAKKDVRDKIFQNMAMRKGNGSVTYSADVDLKACLTAFAAYADKNIDKNAELKSYIDNILGGMYLPFSDAHGALGFIGDNIDRLGLNNYVLNISVTIDKSGYISGVKIGEITLNIGDFNGVVVDDNELKSFIMK